MDWLSEYALFLAKSLTVLAVLFALMFGASLFRRPRGRAPRGRLLVEHLNKQYESMAATVATATRRDFRPTRRLWWRKNPQQPLTPESPRKRVFVLDFDGDIRASAVASLRVEITAVLTSAGPEDEVLLRLESAGGLVHAYGLAASQVQRLKQRGLRLTIAVDKIAASGGYMMACIADHLIAAPFAVVGSIGVVAQSPNLHRFLKKHDIDYELFKAGDRKRTITLFGENTNEDRAKFREQMEETHALFKDFVSGQRPQLNMDEVANGEYWYGSQALQLKLVDELRTSDDYLLEASATKDLYKINYLRRRTPLESIFALREETR